MRARLLLLKQDEVAELELKLDEIAAILETTLNEDHYGLEKMA